MAEMENNDDDGDDIVWARRRCFVAQIFTNWLKIHTHNELCKRFGKDLGLRLSAFLLWQYWGEMRLRKYGEMIRLESNNAGGKIKARWQQMIKYIIIFRAKRRRQRSVRE